MEMTSDRPYNKRELDMKFTAVIDRIDELAKDQDDKHGQNSVLLNAIDGKVSVTNGKVKKLEKWQAGLIMAGSVALFMGGIIVSLIVYIYQYQLG